MAVKTCFHVSKVFYADFCTACGSTVYQAGALPELSDEDIEELSQWLTLSKCDSLNYFSNMHCTV